MTARWRIHVVGAGIGGLGAARALRQRGPAVDVVEREPTWTPVGAGIYLPGNAVRCMHSVWSPPSPSVPRLSRDSAAVLHTLGPDRPCTPAQSKR
jgi:2-polyprenyl-6-methoxyphenol hydroxylase-like FAD-dependent oxidoreductase